MGMQYNPKDVSGGGISPGDYPFRVSSAIEEKYGTGNSGLTLVLEVFTPSKAIDVTERIVYVPKALFKMKQLAKCLGFDFDNPPDAKTLRDNKGVVTLRKDRQGKFLEVEAFIENPAAVFKPSSAGPKVAAPVAEEEVPF